MTDDSMPGVREWVRRARSGDREAFDRLFEQLAPAVRADARVRARMSTAESSLSDLLQDSWTRAFCNLAQFIGDETSDEAMLRSLRAWLATIVRRTSINQRRNSQRLKRKKPQPTPVLDEPTVGHLASRDPTPSRVAGRNELIEKLKVLCENVPDPTLRALIQAKLEGASKAQFARDQGLKDHDVRAAEKRLFRQLGAGLEGELT